MTRSKAIDGTWTAELKRDPLPVLLASPSPALVANVRRDLLGDNVDFRPLWTLPEVTRLLRRQQPDGSWAYPGRGAGVRSMEDYDQLETYKTLLTLVDQYRLDRRHPAIVGAADFLFRFQTAKGDFRGIYGSQYTPNYTAGILAVLLHAGYQSDQRMRAGLEWLLSIRQGDGGWVIPFRTSADAAARNYTVALAAPTLYEPDTSKPSSHLVTGIVLRALTAHSHFRRRRMTREAAELLASRLFQRDVYPDRTAADFWEKVTYPFRWTDVVSALDAIALAGVPADAPDVSAALQWLRGHQQRNGMWRAGYHSGASPDADAWVTFAASRVFTRFAAPGNH